ncbi:MAG: hypothetical protein AAF608_08060 [Pseudomonadota bacterium]
MSATLAIPLVMPSASFTPFSMLTYRNQSLDAVFYDLGVLTSEEINQARGLSLAEGRVLRVEPGRGTGVKDLGSAREVLSSPSDIPRHLAVAGVGSSVVGTAAFARNVAEAVAAPVAAVVSGYGMRDLLSEALGGWFWFRTLNKVHRATEDLAASRGQSYQPFASAGFLGADTAALRTLFSADEPLFETVVGHSKGNLAISEGLYQAGDAATDLLESARIITIGAAIYMPDDAKTVVDVMGELDGFGLMNSHADVTIDITMPRAWHHTNTATWCPLDVVDAVRQAITFDARRS